MADSEADYVVLERSGSYPDLLKNTPSNIRRLEDEIEHCKERQKYLAQTRSPSDGEDVGWYFCKVPLAENELAASVPRKEIVGKSDYFRFGMRDSLALEASFLQREEELLSIWWKEYAECSEGPSVHNTSIDPKLDMQPKACSSVGDSSTQSFAVEEERVGVPVKGGLYEVDLSMRHCFPVYWHGENRRVLRGHWFARKGSLDWLPLREDVSEQLEFAYRCKIWHRRTFQPSGLYAARVDLQGSTLGLHALFTGEDDTWEAWLNADASGFSNIISLRGNGLKLRRGYSSSGSPKPTQDELRQQKEEEMDDYCSQVPVRHLVFMVHGIGQRLEKANLVDDVGNFRHITSGLAERHLTSYQRDAQRVLFIPCQWRRGLKLGGETAVENCTLDGVRGLRVMLSATVHDVLYYMSPIYCQEIVNSVSNQLNRLYTKFLKRNPGYDGKVSIYGHSLGSVLSYDILCHQETLSSPFPMEYLFKEHVTEEDHHLDKTNGNSTCRTPTDLHNQKCSSSTGNMEAIVQKEKREDPALTGCDSLTSDIEKTSSVCDQKVHPFPHISESEQFSDLSLDQDVGQDAGQDVTSDVLCEEGNCMDSTSKSCVGYDDLDKLQENASEDTVGKEQLIKCLREEVDSLKARIADLESQSTDTDRKRVKHIGDEEVDVNTPKQLVSESSLKQENLCSYTPHIKYTKLEFKVDTFFAVGSPLGVFLALRNIRIGIGKGKDYWCDERISEEMPACQQMFNIFHPFDPVAYRVEPLVCQEYIGKRPVIIPYHRGGKRLHIGFQEFTEDLAVRSQAVVNNLYTLRVKVLTACQLKNNDDMDEGMEDSSQTEEPSYGSIMMERLTGKKEGRIDHVLQDKTFEHQYYSAIGAHTNYWRDYDTALFILKHLYRDIPEEPSLPESYEEESQKGTTVGFYRSEATNEDLPLTFSDKVLTKEFSRKWRKAVRKP